MAKLTISIPDQLAADARDYAVRRHTTVSAMAARALRAELDAQAARTYQEWLDSMDPDTRAERDAYTALTQQKLSELRPER